MSASLKKKNLFESGIKSPIFSDKNELTEKINSKKLP
jgi:hypothetical protein